jgi:2-dehydro-3-deoxygluconokinase
MSPAFCQSVRSFPRLVAVGECMIELRSTGPQTMARAYGGDTLNTAVYLARLANQQYKVGYATAIGAKDPYSDEMLATWTAEQIETSYVSRLDNRLPGLYTINVDDQGERQFHYWRQNSPAREYFSDAPSLLEQDLTSVDVLYFSGISLAILPPSGRQRLFQALQTLRTQGGKVVFDNNYRPRLWASVQEARAAYEQAYAFADVALITLNDEQAVWGDGSALLSEAEVLDRVQGLSGRGCAEVVVKRGSEPTLLYLTGQPPLALPTEKVARVIDTTAAGDSFAAGYIAARLKGQAPQDAVKAGNRLASVVIQHPGAIIPVSAMAQL